MTYTVAKLLHRWSVVDILNATYSRPKQTKDWLQILCFMYISMHFVATVFSTLHKEGEVEVGGL